MRALVLKAKGLQFKPQHPHKNQRWQTETNRFWELNSQTA